MNSLVVFLAVAALSVLAANQRLLQAGRFLQLAQLSASGLLFLLLGASLGPHQAAILSSEDLRSSQPLLALGLGLGGLLVGLHLDLGLMRKLPWPVYRAALTQAGAAFLLVALPLAPVLYFSARLSLLGAMGAAALLGAVASVSSGHLAVLWYRSGRMNRLSGLSISLLAMLGDLAGLFVLAIALSFGAAAEPLGGVKLVLLACAVGLSCGALVAFLVRRAADSAELMATLLGGVALVSGAAAFLRVSTLIAGLLCGATLALFGGRSVDRIYRTLSRFERPTYLALVFLIGAHLDLTRLEVWAALPAFVALRFLGKVKGGEQAGRVAQGALHLPPRPGYALLAQGGVGLCMLVEYLLLVPGAGSELVFGVGALAALANEVLASSTYRLALEPEERG